VKSKANEGVASSRPCDGFKGFAGGMVWKADNDVKIENM